MDAKPEFVVNAEGVRVADSLNALLAHLRTTLVEPVDLAIATAYFNPGGYRLLADELDHPRSVRLLLGAEPQVPERRVRPLADPVVPRRAERQRLRRALEGHLHDLEADRDLLGFATEADASARRLIEWLRAGRVQVRRLDDAFLHGKAFAVTTHDHGVVAGSSNLTHAGLATNIELNLGQYQPSVVRRVCDWFDGLWDRAAPFDLAAVYDARFAEHAPWVVYLRMLHERYAGELAEEAEDHRVAGVHLTDLQRDGIWRARRILATHHGVLVADEVGLGKTFIAGELIREAVQERRQRVAVIAPATLRDGPWRKFLLDHQLGVQVLSPQELTNDALEYGLGDYAMIVIDEAHGFRNPTTQQADALRRLLAGTPPKDVVLLTATPVNNSLWDLYHLLGYFLPNDAAFAAAGIRSLRGHFARAMALDPDDLTPEHLFDVLDAVAVRRTRSFIKRHYPNDSLRIGGRDVPITFPTPRVHKVVYDLTEAMGGDFFDRFAAALDPGHGASATDLGDAALTLARYAPSRYLLAGRVEAYELQLAGLLRSGLLKRFESSAHAFGRTCRKMAASHEGFLSLLATGKVATGRALDEWMATDSDQTAEVVDYLAVHGEELDDAAIYDSERLAADVAADRDLLLAFAEEAERVPREQDPKLAALVEELAVIAAQARREGVGETDTRDRRKVLVFSYFTDTVAWIADHLDEVAARDPRLADYDGRITAVTGSSGNADDAMWGFAPRTSDAPPAKAADVFDVIVATDVLAEGVNLQQARHVLNYDLPWNPMRLVQRHGRIDRIGSPHREIFLRCTFPDAQLDRLLGLEERLTYKIKQAASAVGAAEHVLPDVRQADIVFTEAREEIDRLRAELDRLRDGDATLFETSGERPGAQSGEEYRKTLAARWMTATSRPGSRACRGARAAASPARAGRRPTSSACGSATIPRPCSGRSACQPTASCDRRWRRPSAAWPRRCRPTGPPRLGCWTRRRTLGRTEPGPRRGRTSSAAGTRRRTRPPSRRAFPSPCGRPRTCSVGCRPSICCSRRSTPSSTPSRPRTRCGSSGPCVRCCGPTTSGSGSGRWSGWCATSGSSRAPAPVPLPVITPDDVHLVCWMAVVPSAGAPEPGHGAARSGGPAVSERAAGPGPSDLALSQAAAGADAVAVYELASVEGTPQGWVGWPRPTAAGAFAVVTAGRSLGPEVVPGDLLLVEPVSDDDPPTDGEEVLVVLEGQHDPETGLGVALRAWWPERDGTGELVGLVLTARLGPGVEPLVVTAPQRARAVGRIVDTASR